MIRTAVEKAARVETRRRAKTERVAAKAARKAAARANDPAGDGLLIDTPQPAYRVGEVIANGVTHGLGVALSISGLTMLLVFAAQSRDSWHLASALVYGISLVMLYSASTLYHSIVLEKARRVFKVIDHGSIYLLIAGTYTPFTLVTLRNDGGLLLFAVVWCIAIAGILVESLWRRRPAWLGLALYLALGWLAVVMMRPLGQHLPAGAVGLLIAGGLAYTFGTVFYAVKKVPYFHMIWHIFVLAGSICHFLAVVLYVMPAGR